MSDLPLSAGPGVKTEAEPSLSYFQFPFDTNKSSSSHDSIPSSRNPSEPPPFSFRLMPSWSQSSAAQHPSDSVSAAALGLHHALSFNDDYDDMSELIDLPNNSGSGGTEKTVRRRSSKGPYPYL